MKIIIKAKPAIEVLRNKHNQLIARIHKLSNGVLEIRDDSNKPLGRFYPERNKTYDSHYRFIGTGNLLVSLIARI